MLTEPRLSHDLDIGVASTPFISLTPCVFQTVRQTTGYCYIEQAAMIDFM